jgi:hypothetical protein
MRICPFAVADESAVVELRWQCDLVRHVEAVLEVRGSLKVNLEVRTTNHAVVIFIGGLDTPPMRWSAWVGGSFRVRHKANQRSELDIQSRLRAVRP